MIKRNLLLFTCAAILSGCGSSHTVIPGELQHSTGGIQPLVRQSGQPPTNWEEFDAGPYDGSNDIGITRGPDGNMWFTDGGGAVGKVSMGGIVTKYPMPSPNNVPEFIVTGPSSTLWFNEYEGHIGRVTTSGVISEFLIPIPGELTQGITRGPDGDFWFSEEQPGDLQPIRQVSSTF
jgi:streptogramin lyase